jgi:hypothetical protein
MDGGGARRNALVRRVGGKKLDVIRGQADADFHTWGRLEVGMKEDNGCRRDGLRIIEIDRALIG